VRSREMLEIWEVGSGPDVGVATESSGLPAREGDTYLSRGTAAVRWLILWVLLCGMAMRYSVVRRPGASAKALLLRLA
jgi:hypothetical protein